MIRSGVRCNWCSAAMVRYKFCCEDGSRDVFGGFLLRRGELPSCLGVGKTTIPAVGTSVGRFFVSSILSRHRDVPGEVEPTECPWPAPSQAGCLRGRVRGKSDKAPVLLPLPHLGPVPFCVQDPGEQSRGSATWAPSMVPQLSLPTACPAGTDGAVPGPRPAP